MQGGGWQLLDEAEQQGNGLPVHRLRDGDAAEGWIQAVVHFRFAQPNAEHLGILWDTDAAASQGIQATLGHAVILVVDDTGALAENAVFLGGGAAPAMVGAAWKVHSGWMRMPSCRQELRKALVRWLVPS